jgi:hypothetical protein
MTILSRQIGLSELRDQTQWFIDDDPTTISLIPKSTPVRKPSGGYDYKGTVTPKAPQTFKIIPTGAGWSNPVTETDGGFASRAAYVLVGTYNSDMDIGDHWSDGDVTYTIADFLVKNDYEIKANVTAFGTELNYG